MHVKYAPIGTVPPIEPFGPCTWPEPSEPAASVRIGFSPIEVLPPPPPLPLPLAASETIAEACLPVIALA